MLPIYTPRPKFEAWPEISRMLPQIRHEAMSGVFSILCHLSWTIHRLIFLMSMILYTGCDNATLPQRCLARAVLLLLDLHAYKDKGFHKIFHLTHAKNKNLRYSFEIETYLFAVLPIYTPRSKAWPEISMLHQIHETMYCYSYTFRFIITVPCSLIRGLLSSWTIHRLIFLMSMIL